MRDLDIRNKLSVLLRETFETQDPTSRIVDEFSLCQGTSRIDMAVINGSFHGYEIKSEVDTLARLDSQFETYSKNFDYLTFVVSEKHLTPLRQRIPKWCGIMVAYDAGNQIVISEVRKPRKNSIDPHSIAQLLWRDEAITILNDLGHVKGLSGKTKKQLWNELVELMSANELSQYVRDAIKQRPFWRVDQQLSLNGD